MRATSSTGAVRLAPSPSTLVVFLSAVLAAAALAEGPSAIDPRDTRLLSQPAVNARHLAFAYDDDLWLAELTAEADGSRSARRITSHEGREQRPRFSPDGSLIAFSGEYEGNLDVYLVPVEGGVPRRLTWHPGPDLVEGFTPDGSAVLFSSQRTVHTRRFTQLFTVPVEGGFPRRLPLPSGIHASYAADGGAIAYQPLQEVSQEWKNYRGGAAARIWIYDFATGEVTQVPQPPGRSNDLDPMWIGDRVYFRSDRSGEINLFSFDPTSGEVRQLTHFVDFPVLSASAEGAGARIAFEQAGWLHLLETRTGRSERLRVAAASDLKERRPRFAKGAEFVRSTSLSPSGARAAFEFRGEILTVPAEKGSPRNLTRSVAANERSPAWSPDGSRIAWLSDVSGEYQLVVAPQDGEGEARSYELGGAGFYEDLEWSPDGRHLSYVDNSWSLFVIELESGAITKVASQPQYGPARARNLAHSWSPDSRWLAYTLDTRTSIQRLFVYSVAGSSSHPVTDGLSEVSEPVFDAGGKYLWFLGSTNAGPVKQWFAMSTADMEMTRSLYLAVLARGVESPLKPESDEEGGESEEEEAESEAGDPEIERADRTAGRKAAAAGGASAAAKGGESKEAPVEVKIDFDGIDQRIVAVPVEAGPLRGLAAGEEGTVLYLRSESPRGGPGSLRSYDLAKREERTLLASEVAGFRVSADGTKVLYRAGDSFAIAKLTGEAIDAAKGKLAVSALEVKIDPVAEWGQIFAEAWRINRDYFYDPGMHGADWPAMREKYSVFLPHLATRDDLNRVLQWMSSELGVGHHRVGGGDERLDLERVGGGLLGADFEIDSGRYRFAKVYGGLNWDPELRAPLTAPGVDAVAGEYLLAVDGRELTAAENVFSRFEETVGKNVELTIGPRPDGEGSRTVTVVPIESEAALRNRDWVEGNLKKVSEATDGRVAYVYVPDTASLGHTYFKRYFFPQADREAIIVDERHNSGGQVADYYIDHLRRPFISYWATRYGNDLVTPSAGIQGPKVMIIDETAGSGGDLLPWMFRKLGLGTLVGRRTWGGLVGVLGFPVLMDGGFITAPNLAIWTEDGFVVENEGVPPDIEIEQWPAEVEAGHDPQLEKAIEVVLEELRRNPPPPKPERPPYPVRALSALSGGRGP